MTALEDAGRALAAARARRDSHFPDADAAARDAGHAPGTPAYDASVGRICDLWSTHIAAHQNVTAQSPSAVPTAVGA